MANSLKISIITVSYNSEKTIRDTIESVLSQKYSSVEYIVVDGSSTDNTMSIVAEYGGSIATVVSEPDKGIYDAMNKGIALATGDVIGILNSDDFYENDSALDTVAAAFRRNPESALIFGDVVFVDPEDLKHVTRVYTAGHFKAWKLRFGWMPPHPGTFIRTDVYKEVGLYSTLYTISADYEMFVRLLLLKQFKFAHINKVLVRMRSGGVSTSGFKSSLKLNMEIVQACRRNGVYTNLLMVLSKIPFKLMEFVKRSRPGN
ncbi:glycosyltransferase [Pseudomonas yamanorum]|uniref:glycosyltransferase family 2 protein n=1 Tax=Pseudomonas yamanorum TaxID=515393 RepID=UPI0015A2CA17|nr:glycosyltransferase family 2 protein [Pseudomonas yamanorum]NWD23835.1 glycosyltransferase [Pseudomonas yamanorum]